MCQQPGKALNSLGATVSNYFMEPCLVSVALATDGSLSTGQLCGDRTEPFTNLPHAHSELQEHPCISEEVLVFRGCRRIPVHVSRSG